MAKRKASGDKDLERDMQRLLEKHLPKIKKAIVAAGLEEKLRRQPLAVTTVVGGQLFALMITRTGKAKARQKRMRGAKRWAK
jgi:hypothetical protein